MNVHLINIPDPDVSNFLSSKLNPKIELTSGPKISRGARYEILIAGRPNRDHLTISPKIRAVIVPYAGVPKDTLVLMQEFPHIHLHNLHHNAIPTAELAFSLLLSAAKFIVPLDRSLREGDWRPRYRPTKTILLKGKTALILGYGHIGKHIAKLCKSMGMKVLIIRRKKYTEGAGDLDGQVHPVEELPTYLSMANVLIITLPLTAATENLIGKAEIAALPENALVVNVGRGAIINQEALYQGLKDGKLAAAGLDVWYNYPEDERTRARTFPADYPFHELDNVVMSPHRGGATQETESLRMTHLANMLNTAIQGNPMPNLVDLQAGY